MDIRCVKDSLRQEVDMDTNMNSDGNSPCRQEFDNFCKEFHQKAVLNGNLTSVMTVEIEENLIKYLLHPQETVAYTETTNWLENFVFCVVSNDDVNSCELHIWNDGQKRAVSLENYYSLLTALYREQKCKTLEDFTKKINEKYVLIPGEVIKYFYNLQTQKKPLLHSQKKGTRHLRCKITSYEYVKKTVYKKRILTEITNTLNGNVVVSNCQEEDATDGDLYSVEKTERICEIINNDVNELSCTSYPSNQFLEVKYAGTKSLALFPENELQNQEHLLTLSSVLYNAGAVPEKTGEVQLEFAIPHKPPKKAVDIDVLSTLSDKTGKLLQTVTLNGQKAKKKPAKELKGKLSIVSNPVTKGATLKCVENNSQDASPVKQSYYELAAAAATAGSTITNVPSEVDNVQNFMEGVTNIFDDDDDRSPNISNEVDEGCNVLVERISDGARLPAATKEEEEANTINKDNSLTCGGCGKTMKNKMILNRHIAKNSCQKILLTSSINCKICNEEIPKNRAIAHQEICKGVVPKSKTMVHEEVLEPMLQGDTEQALELMDENVVGDKSKHRVCPHCGLILKNEVTFNKHLNRHKRPGFLCNICGDLFQDKTTLHGHMNEHLGLNPYKCNQCEESFASSHQRSMHVFKEHVPKRFQCNFCDKSYKSRPNLQLHLRVHSGKRVFTCYKCNKDFPTKETLKEHSKKHEVASKFYCIICERGYHKKSNFTHHMKKQHPDSYIKNMS